MDVTLITTEGRARSAEIEVAGHRLTVVDHISPVGQPSEPGPVANARFEAVTRELLPAERALAGSPSGEKELHHQWGWRYLGRGEIVSLAPVRADLGILILELDQTASESRRIGDMVTIPIDRIILTRTAARP